MIKIFKNYHFTWTYIDTPWNFLNKNVYIINDLISHIKKNEIYILKFIYNLYLILQLNN